jgi:Tol biopolymer transport system component
MQRTIGIVFLLMVLFLPVRIFAGETSAPTTVDRLAFVSQRDGQANVYVVNEDGSNLVKLTTAGKKESYSAPIWSPDGTKIIFKKLVGLSILNRKCELWIADSDGSNQSKITENLRPDPPPVWSPDGTKVLFLAKQGNKEEIYLYNLSDNAISNISYGKIQKISDYHLSWSPDGLKIVGVFNVKGNTDVYFMDIEDGTLTKLTGQCGDYRDPVCSPDGAKVAFYFDKAMPFGKLSGLYLINADGRNEIFLGEDNLISDITWTPDSTGIACTKCTDLSVRNETATSAGNYNYAVSLYELNRTGSSCQSTVTGTVRSRPVWSPDGKKVAFIHGSVVNVLESGTKHLVKIKIPNATGIPAWSPDSTQIACAGSSSAFKKTSLYIAPLDGGSIVQITKETGDNNPVWAPDNSQ